MQIASARLSISDNPEKFGCNLLKICYNQIHIIRYMNGMSKFENKEAKGSLQWIFIFLTEFSGVFPPVRHTLKAGIERMAGLRASGMRLPRSRVKFKMVIRRLLRATAIIDMRMTLRTWSGSA